MSLISPNFDVKSIIHPNFGQGPFPKIAGKALEAKDYHICCGEVFLEHIENIFMVP